MLDLQQKLNTIGADNAELRSQIDAKARRLAELEAALGDAAKKIAAQETKLRLAQQMLNEKDTAAKRLNDDLVAARTAKTDAEKQATQLNNQQTVLTAQITALDNDVRRQRTQGDNAYLAWAAEKRRPSFKRQRWPPRYLGTRLSSSRARRMRPNFQIRLVKWNWPVAPQKQIATKRKRI